MLCAWCHSNCLLNDRERWAGSVFSWIRCTKDTEAASSGHCGSVQLSENDWLVQDTKVRKIKKRTNLSNQWTFRWHNHAFVLTLPSKNLITSVSGVLRSEGWEGSSCSNISEYISIMKLGALLWGQGMNACTKTAQGTVDNIEPLCLPLSLFSINKTLSHDFWTDHYAELQVSGWPTNQSHSPH